MRALLELVVRVFGIAPASRLRLAGLVGISLLVTATYLAQGVLIAQVVIAVFAGSGTGAVWWQAAAILALQALRAGLLTVREAAAPRVSGKVKDAIRERLAGRLFELGPGRCSARAAAACRRRWSTQWSCWTRWSAGSYRRCSPR